MKVRLDQIHDEPYIWHETLHVPVAQLVAPELAGLSEIDVRGRIVRSEAGLFFKVRMVYDQTLVCNRCLGETQEPVSTELELMILTERPASAGGEHELHEEDLGILYVDGDVLETVPLVVEQVQLALPMKPLCRPDCQGLCPSCGADLNQGRCGCATATTDPRWAALAALRDRIS